MKKKYNIVGDKGKIEFSYEDIVNLATSAKKSITNIELLLSQVNKLILIIKELHNYKLGYNILMEYWDSLPDEEKEIINSKLKKLNL